MGRPQIITTPAGEELVILPRSDYEALLARAGDEAAEDIMTARIVDETGARLAAGQDVALPESVWVAIEAGESAVRAIRRHRGQTQAELAALAGVGQAYISEIESGRKTGTPETLAQIARALGVPLDALVE